MARIALYDGSGEERRGNRGDQGVIGQENSIIEGNAMWKAIIGWILMVLSLGLIWLIILMIDAPVNEDRRYDDED